MNHPYHVAYRVWRIVCSVVDMEAGNARRDAQRAQHATYVMEPIGPLAIDSTGENFGSTTLSVSRCRQKPVI